MRRVLFVSLALLALVCALVASPARAAAASSPRFLLDDDATVVRAEAELYSSDDATSVEPQAESAEEPTMDVGLVEVDAAADVSAEAEAEAEAQAQSESEAVVVMESEWPRKHKRSRIAARKRAAAAARATRIVPIIDDTGSAVEVPRANLTQFKVKPLIDARLVLDSELTVEPTFPWQRPPPVPVPAVAMQPPAVPSQPPAVPAVPAAPATPATPLAAAADLIPAAGVVERLSDVLTAPLSNEAAELKLDSDFQNWMVRFGRVYSGAEALQRQAVYMQNMERAKQLSAQTGAQFSVEGPYADFEQGEFVKLLKAHTDVDRQAASLIQSAEAAHPADGDILFESASGARMQASARQLSVDWRSLSTPVKNQDRCGASWALAAAAVLESAQARTSSSAAAALTPLSAQQLVDCNREGQNACAGGSVLNALAFWQNHGSTPAESYSWMSGQGNCSNADGPGPRVATSGFALPPCVTGDCKEQGARETQLIEQLSTYGPLAIMLDLSSLQLYQSGVVDARSGCSSSGESLNHAAVLVGYNPQGYWIVRNSMSDSWGEAGYLRLAFGANVCGVANYPLFVQTA